MITLTLYISVSHIFTILGKGILEIISCFQFNKSFSTGATFFRVGETHSVYFPNNITVCKKEKKKKDLKDATSYTFPGVKEKFIIIATIQHVEDFYCTAKPNGVEAQPTVFRCDSDGLFLLFCQFRQ